MAIKKDLSRYYALAKDLKLDSRHRKTIEIFNRIENGVPEKNLPGLRTIIQGRELTRIATSTLLGLFSVSDFNPGFTYKELRQSNGDFFEETARTESILVAGNIILTGLPGGGKTLLLKTLGSLCDMTFKKIQMTPDLIPRDLTVKTVMLGNKIVTRLGPAFAHILLADEINRATPKTQSALLERMSSGTLTYDNEEGREITKTLPQPCFTMATRNPIEQEGTYPLPEAQLDRFLMNIILGLPSRETIEDVLEFVPGFRDTNIKPLASAEEILDCRNYIVEKIEVSKEIRRYIVDLILATYNPFELGLFPELKEKAAGENLILLPPNTRAALHLMNISKTVACIDGHCEVEPYHVKKRFYEVVNHRFVINRKLRGLMIEYGGLDNFIHLLIKGDHEKGIKGILDIVPLP